MFGLGVPELIIILVIALIIFGPKKLPEIGKSLGQGIREFRKSTSAIESQVKEDMEAEKKSEPAEEEKPPPTDSEAQ